MVPTPSIQLSANRPASPKGYAGRSTLREVGSGPDLRRTADDR